jgi:hypothetical protein
MSKENENKKTTKEKLLLAVPTVLLLGAQACGASEAGAGSAEGAQQNEHISRITVHQGANIRENPDRVVDSVDGDLTLIGQTKKPLTIETIHGTKVVENVDGTWYAVPAKDVAEILDEQGQDGLADKVGKDKDGQVWVNKQRATPEYDK